MTLNPNANQKSSSGEQTEQDLQNIIDSIQSNSQEQLLEEAEDAPKFGG